MSAPTCTVDSALPVPNPACVLAEVPDGAVLYLPDTEHYFGLSPSAVMIWQLLPPVSRTLAELCSALASTYPDVPAEMLRLDACELLADLQRLQLVGPPTEA